MDPRAIVQLLESGLAHHRANRLPEAEAAYRQVLGVQPDNPDALHLLGVLAAQCGHVQGALPLLQRAVQRLPDNGEFNRHLAEVFATLGRHAEALDAFGRAIQIDPRDAAARSEAGASLLAMGRIPEALEQIGTAAQLLPTDPIAQSNWGHALARAGRIDEAVGVLRRAVVSDPNCGPAWLHLAEALWRGARYDEAVEPAQRGIELIGDTDPRNQIIYGNVLHTAGDLEGAGAAYRRALALNADSFDASSNLALVLLKTGEVREALAMYEQIIARWPGKRDALANRSLALLMLGDFERGFADYEARWDPATVAAHRRLGTPWDGSPPAGKTLLLVSEQGYGDTIQFVRYATILADRGARVMVSCPAEIEPLVRTVRGVAHVVRPGEPIKQPFDAFVPLASLPRTMGTRLQTIPASVPYVVAELDRVERWRERLAGDANFKVGVVWAGSSVHQNDRIRSCSLAELAPLAAVAGVSLYSLQKGSAAAQIGSAPVGMNVVSLGDELKDFGDTAALLEVLDLLISVDTSVIHVAGALNRPVWTLLARGPDWRWMIERDDSPWYPSMRLFRQERLKDWRPVVERAASELASLVKARQAQAERTVQEKPKEQA